MNVKVYIKKYAFHFNASTSAKSVISNKNYEHFSYYITHYFSPKKYPVIHTLISRFKTKQFSYWKILIDNANVRLVM